MTYAELFRYCPKCKSDLRAEENKILICAHCDFSFHINPAPCNAIIMENSSGEILLAKRKHDPKKDMWDLPGGFINPGESAEESIIREVKEELSIDITDFRYFGSCADQYEYKGINYSTLGIVFVGRVNDQKLTPADDVKELRFFVKEKIPFDDIAFDSVKRTLQKYIKN